MSLAKRLHQSILLTGYEPMLLNFAVPRKAVKPPKNLERF
jgi:hypothetical protein